MSSRSGAHPVIWTPERIKRFFDFYSTQPNMEDNYFSRQRGSAVLRLMLRHAPLSGPVLDLGCGPGYFLEQLAGHWIECCGVDLSRESVEAAQRRLEGNPLFLGASAMSEEQTLPCASDSFEAVFLMETVEHLLPGETERLFGEIVRVLRPGGHLIVTTPYRENLEASMAVCPECGCEFHSVQHIHSFDPGRLARLVSQYGLEVARCAPAILLPDWTVWRRARRSRSGWRLMCPECATVFPSPRSRMVRSAMKTLKEVLHLVCVCRKEARRAGGPG